MSVNLHGAERILSVEWRRQGSQTLPEQYGNISVGFYASRNYAFMIRTRQELLRTYANRDMLKKSGSIQVLVSFPNQSLAEYVEGIVLRERSLRQGIQRNQAARSLMVDLLCAWLNAEVFWVIRSVVPNYDSKKSRHHVVLYFETKTRQNAKSNGGGVCMLQICSLS